MLTLPIINKLRFKHLFWWLSTPTASVANDDDHIELTTLKRNENGPSSSMNQGSNTKKKDDNNAPRPTLGFGVLTPNAAIKRIQESSASSTNQGSNTRPMDDNNINLLRPNTVKFPTSSFSLKKGTNSESNLVSEHLEQPEMHRPESSESGCRASESSELHYCPVNQVNCSGSNEGSTSGQFLHLGVGRNSNGSGKQTIGDASHHITNISGDVYINYTTGQRGNGLRKHVKR